MFPQVVSYDFPLHRRLHEYFFYLALAPLENPEGVANQEGYLRCLKRFGDRVTLEVLSLFEFKSIDDVGAGKANQRNVQWCIQTHTPYTVGSH